MQRQLPELLASLGESGIASQYLPLSHSICCKLCLGIFNNSKVLPCLHSFCLSCLQVYVRKSPKNLKDRKLLCPTCQEYFQLPGTGLKGLLNNTVIERSIESNVPTLALRKKQEPLFPGLYAESDDTYEVVVKRQDPNKINHEKINGKQDENEEWQNFMQLQKSTDSDLESVELTENKKYVNISEALKGLSDEERLEKLTNSLKNTFSFSQALQDHEVRLENQVRALRTPSTSSEYSFTQRDFLQEQLSSLQTEAMNIIYRLDSIKSSVDTWERCRSHVEHQIHTKVEQIIAMVRQAERQLLNQIDSYSENNTPTNPVREAKQKLQYLLKNILGVIDFVRLVLTYGSGRDIEVFEQLILDRCDHLLSQVISIEKTELAFSNTHVEEEEIEKLLGYLTFSTSSEDIWKYREGEVMVSPESVFTDGKQDLTPLMAIPPSFSREFQETMEQLADHEHSQSYTPDSLLEDESEHQRLTVDQLIHKFSTEFGMRYNEIIVSDSSSRSTPMTSSLTSENPYPSPIPEEINGNGISEGDFQRLPTRHRSRSHKRRHTVSDVQQDLAHARIDLSDNRYRGLVRSRKNSTPDVMAISKGERPLSNDIEQTKRMLALCKRQLLEAKSMGVFNPKGYSTQSSSTGTPDSKMSRSASLSRDNSPMTERLTRSHVSHDYLSRSLTDHNRLFPSNTAISRESSPIEGRGSRTTGSHELLSQSLTDQRMTQSDDKVLSQHAGHRKSQSVDHGLLQASISNASREHVHKISHDYVQQIRSRLGMDKPV